MPKRLSCWARISHTGRSIIFCATPIFRMLDAASTNGKITDLNYTRMGQVRRDFKIRIAPFDDGQIILIIFDITMELSVERIQSEFVAMSAMNCVRRSPR